MITYYALNFGDKVTNNTAIFPTLEKLLSSWSTYHRNKNYEYAYITRYTDENTPNCPLMDLHFNEYTDKEYEEPFISLI